VLIYNLIKSTPRPAPTPPENSRMREGLQQAVIGWDRWRDQSADMPQKLAWTLVGRCRSTLSNPD